MWKPEPAWAWAQLGLATVLVALMPVVDRLGWVLLVPVALCAGASGFRDLLLTPVLTANAEGLSVVDGVRRVAAGWSEVDRVRTVRDRRTPLLELDLAGHVVVLSQRRLGAPVGEVLADLERLRVS
jgi:hypothetical protein